MSEGFDVIVVGTGGIGSAAALQLARRGVRVLGLDRFPPAHGRGSSHGQTRLIRLAYYEHPDYVPLLLRAHGLWHALAADVGRELLVESGLAIAGPETGAVVAGTRRAADRHDLALERLTPAEAMARWPALRIPADWVALHEPRAGYLRVEDCVRAQMAEAIRAGADLRHGLTVAGWEADADAVRVTTDRGVFVADRLVLCPGAWAADLLRLPVPTCTVLRKSLFWFDPPAAAGPVHAAGRLPCFAFDTPAGFCYGFPALDHRGVKLAEHTGGQLVADPLLVDRRIDAADAARIDGWIDAHLPLLGHARTAHTVCLYTMSPDGHFLLGTHPDHEQVTIAAGFSGHGFKFAPVIGEAVADLASCGRTLLPIGFLSPTRFGSARG